MRNQRSHVVFDGFFSWSGSVTTFDLAPWLAAWNNPHYRVGLAVRSSVCLERTPLLLLTHGRVRVSRVEQKKKKKENEQKEERKDKTHIWYNDTIKSEVCDIFGTLRMTICVVLSSADSCRKIHIYTGYIPTQWITDAGRPLYKIITSHFIARVRKSLLRVCVWEGAEDRTFWGPLCWVLAFFTASYQHLLWTSAHQGPRPLRPGVALSTPSRLQLRPQLYCNCHWDSTQLSYIIVQRPLDHPLDLWNRMFNRHQAEINVMQFTGHSLPVCRSTRVSWDLPCPISSANFRPRDFLSWLPL